MLVCPTSCFVSFFPSSFGTTHAPAQGYMRKAAEHTKHQRSDDFAVREDANSADQFTLRLLIGSDTCL